MERLYVGDRELTARMHECREAVAAGGEWRKLSVQQDGTGALAGDPAFAAWCAGDPARARAILNREYLTVPPSPQIARHIEFVRRIRRWTQQGVHVSRVVFVDEASFEANRLCLAYLRELLARINGPWGGEQTYWIPSGDWQRAGIRPPRHDWCLYGTRWVATGYNRRGAVSWRGFLHPERGEEDARTERQLVALIDALASLQTPARLLPHMEPPGAWPHDRPMA